MIRPSDIRQINQAFKCLDQHPLYSKYQERFRKICYQMARQEDNSALPTFSMFLRQLALETNSRYNSPELVNATYWFIDSVREVLRNASGTTWKRVWMYLDAKPDPRDMGVVCSTVDLNHRYKCQVLVPVVEAAALTQSTQTSYITPAFMIGLTVDRKLEGTV